jgi:hypothetical protein
MKQDDAPGRGPWRRRRWRKSSYSGTAGNCVEVAQLDPELRAVRDSKNPDGPILTCTAQHWSAFTARLPTSPLPPFPRNPSPTTHTPTKTSS